MPPGVDLIRATILRLLEQRGQGKTICPSEAARALDPEGFRDLMPAVRSVAGTLAEERAIRVTQGDREVDVSSVRGPVRLGLR